MRVRFTLSWIIGSSFTCRPPPSGESSICETAAMRRRMESPPKAAQQSTLEK